MVNSRNIAAHGAVDDSGMIDDVHCLMTSQTRLNYLADVFDVGDGVESPGDLFYRNRGVRDSIRVFRMGAFDGSRRPTKSASVMVLASLGWPIAIFWIVESLCKARR